VPVKYSYTSTPTIGRAACTEPQCLYKGAPLPLPLLQKNTKDESHMCVQVLDDFIGLSTYLVGETTTELWCIGGRR